MSNTIMNSGSENAPHSPDENWNAEAQASEGADAKANTKTLPEFDELADQIGEFIHYWGFKRVHGRIWTHLFLADRPLDAADLVRDMKISKALVSISLRELMEYEVVVEAGKSARGTNLYRTNPDILSVILNVLRQREKRMLSRIQAAKEALDRVGDGDKQTARLSAQRLAQLSKLINNATSGLDSLISLRSVDFGEWRSAFMAGDELEAVERSKPAPSNSAATPSTTPTKLAAPLPMVNGVPELASPSRFAPSVMRK